MDDLLESMGISSELIHSRIEPVDSKRELVSLEAKYGLDTATVLDEVNREDVLNTVNTDDLKHWNRAYGTFLDFGGNIADINTCSGIAYISEVNEVANNNIQKAAFADGEAAFCMVLIYSIEQQHALFVGPRSGETIILHLSHSPQLRYHQQ